jgi:drug/metabolite transporter (DMT)-like permease
LTAVHRRRPPTSAVGLGVVMALGAAVLFAVNATASKVLMEAGLTSVQLVALRSAGAALCLLGLVAVTRPAALRVTRDELAYLAVFGITGIAFVQWFYFVAIRRLPVGIALLLEYTAPLLVALWVRFVRHEQVRRRVWAALVLCMGGLAVVAQVWSGLRLDAVGVAAGLAAAVSLAAYYLLGEHGLGRRDSLSLSAWTFFFSALLWSVVQPWWQFPFAVLGADMALPGPLSAFAAPGWTLGAWVVLLGTVAPFLLVLGAIGKLGAHRVGLLGMAEPVAAGMVAWVLLGEVLTGVQLVGAGIVMVGIALAETARRTPVEAATPLPEGIAP